MPYNQKIGMKLPYQDADISTKMIRQFTIAKQCNEGIPCHVYPTFPQDASTGVIINIHTHESQNKVQLEYDLESNYKISNQLRYKISNMDQSIKIDIEYKGNRYLHQTMIRNLKSNSEYRIRVYYAGYDNKYYKDYKYRTFQKQKLSEQQELRIIVGGDVSTSQKAQDMTQNLLSFGPSAIFLGGDIAYDDGQTYCYYAFDQFFKMMDHFTVQNENYMIPIFYAVGNHDVGLNNDPNTVYPSDKLTPLYIQYLPQGIPNHLPVPPISNRSTIVTTTFANILFMSLDVGYTQSVNGWQYEYIKKQMHSNPSLLKFAQYHDPTYTSCIREDQDVFHNLQTLLKWNSLFDQYKLIAAFENHAHLFKVTHKLRGNIKNKNGTLYLGDGAWGALLNDCRLNKDPELFQAVDRKYNAWKVTINSTWVKFQGVDEYNNLLFQEQSEISRYIT